MGLNNCCFCIPLRTGVTAIAVISSAFYVAMLIWLIKDRNIIYSFPQQDLSAASAVFWTAVSVVGVYAVSSLFGVIGGITQNRNMVNIFRFLYWAMAVLLLLSSVGIWIVMMVKKSSIVLGCQQYLTELNTANSPYSAVVLPNGTSTSVYADDCASATKQFLIVSGVIILVGNFVQIYFASTINAYARRLKASGGGSAAQHHKLRDMDDFPETSKMTVY
ncbi:hypothetical protein INT47_001664 [Mucor saturninus]|uniref:Tetraspanin n=1 Tax=Mucor saturninus TaxID=64648 RepID=A0A8H7RKN6_9FUNG|nr:hypothetical protein INT47_001664 [Mucor saturninus]